MIASASFTERFWAKVNKDGPIMKPELGPCWAWTRSTMTSGYGQFQREDKRWTGTHRLSWELAHGPIPKGLWVLHRCDFKRCVNPSHLYLGTHIDNCRDRSVAGNYIGVKGAQNRIAKLSDEAVREARRLYAVGDVGLRALSQRFGVSARTLNSAITGETWGHIPDALPKGGRRFLYGELNVRAKLTAEQVLEIKTRTESNRFLADIYGVTRQSIRDVRNGKTWARGSVRGLAA